MIEFQKFMDSIESKHNYLINDFMEGLKFLVESGNSAISYDTTKKIVLFNVPVLETDKDGNYFYDFIWKRDVDAIDNILYASTDKDTKLSFIIQGIEYPEIDEFLFVSSIYVEMRFRFTFKKLPKIEDVIFIHNRNFLFNQEKRNELMKNEVSTKKFLYSGGVVIAKPS